MDPISRRDAGKILLAGYAGLLVDGREAWASTATKNQQPALSTPQKQSPPSKATATPRSTGDNRVSGNSTPDWSDAIHYPG
jgi:hypothetical protein